LQVSAGLSITKLLISEGVNQINNVLAFPGIFRGALDVRAKEINEEMKKAAAYALAELIHEYELNTNYVIPKPFDKRVGPHVVAAVAQAAVNTNVARIKIDYEKELKNAKKMIGK